MKSLSATARPTLSAAAQGRESRKRHASAIARRSSGPTVPAPIASRVAGKRKATTYTHGSRTPSSQREKATAATPRTTHRSTASDVGSALSGISASASSGG